jgi:hypothetical protein
VTESTPKPINARVSTALDDTMASTRAVVRSKGNLSKRCHPEEGEKPSEGPYKVMLRRCSRKGHPAACTNPFHIIKARHIRKVVRAGFAAAQDDNS